MAIDYDVHTPESAEQHAGLRSQVNGTGSPYCLSEAGQSDMAIGGGELLNLATDMFNKKVEAVEDALSRNHNNRGLTYVGYCDLPKDLTPEEIKTVVLDAMNIAFFAGVVAGMSIREENNEPVELEGEKA